MCKRGPTYLVGFYDRAGNLYDYCDGVDTDAPTWEYVDIGLSRPQAKFALFWRKDGQPFTMSEAEHMTKCVGDRRKDLEDDSGNVLPLEFVMKHIGKACLMISWSPLPKISSWTDVLGGFSRWTGFAQWARIEIADISFTRTVNHKPVREMREWLADLR